MSVNNKISLIVGITLVTQGCFHEETDSTQNTSTNQSITSEIVTDIKAVAYPYHLENGNRLVSGQGDLPNLTFQDISLPSSVVWIAALADGNQSIWSAVLKNGDVKAFRVGNGNVEEIDISPSQVNNAMPPTLVLQNDGALKLANNFEDGSQFTGPVILDNSTGQMAYVADNGDVVLKTGTNEQRLAVNALPYARLLVDENKRLLVLTEPTSRYDHLAVLGSAFKHASSITIINTKTTFEVDSTITISAPDVIEGNGLIWVDVNNDGLNEIITTLANSTEGGRIVVFNEDGTEYGSSTAIGINHRWRHQIAVAPYKDVNELSLVSVYIPHITPHIEFFRLDDESITITNKSISYSSHLFTGINIDMSITGDFDNDSQIEVLLVKSGSRNEIAAYSFSGTDIVQDWTLPLSSAITSNVAATTLTDGKIAYGVGQGSILRLWHP